MKRLFVAVGGLLLLSGSINPAEFECEEAVAHLRDCCPANDAIDALQCGGSCASVDLDIQSARCLRMASCETLRASGACAQPTVVECE
jgi:hypothetical protein